MRSIVRVQSIYPRPQLNNFSRATVPLRVTRHIVNFEPSPRSVLFPAIVTQACCKCTNTRLTMSAHVLVDIGDHVGDREFSQLPKFFRKPRVFPETQSFPRNSEFSKKREAFSKPRVSNEILGLTMYCFILNEP